MTLELVRIAIAAVTVLLIACSLLSLPLTPGSRAEALGELMSVYFELIPVALVGIVVSRIVSHSQPLKIQQAEDATLDAIMFTAGFTFPAAISLSSYGTSEFPTLLVIAPMSYPFGVVFAMLFTIFPAQLLNFGAIALWRKFCSPTLSNV